MQIYLSLSIIWQAVISIYLFKFQEFLSSYALIHIALSQIILEKQNILLRGPWALGTYPGVKPKQESPSFHGFSKAPVGGPSHAFRGLYMYIKFAR